MCVLCGCLIVSTLYWCCVIGDTNDAPESLCVCHTNKEIFGPWRTNFHLIPAHSTDARPLLGSEECEGRVITLSSLSRSSGRSCPAFVVSQVTLSKPSRLHGWPPLISLIRALPKDACCVRDLRNSDSRSVPRAICYFPQAIPEHFI